MKKDTIVLGTSGNAFFELPLDAVAQTFAITAIRGAGKTTTAKVMAEEFYRFQLPWTALDPVGVWWGMRSGRDGSADGGLPVVVFGGKKPDVPLGKDDGERIAEALLETNICSVIDLSQESKKTWRRFLTAFCRRAMALESKTPHHFFIEETPEFCPQRTKVAVTAESKEAVERLVRLGRNQGYGCTLIMQRPATVDKDVLSQCENLIVMRTVGKHDRKACDDWLEPKFYTAEKSEKDVREEVRRLTATLPSLPDGDAYFWSPSWLRVFKRVSIRQSATFHPGATRKVGDAIRVAVLADAREFVERIKGKLARKVVPVKESGSGEVYGVVFEKSDKGVPENSCFSDDGHQGERLDDLRAENESLKAKLADATARADSIARLWASKVDSIRKILGPQYETLRQLFSEIGEKPETGAADRSIYEQWLAKAGRRGCKRMLEVVLERGSLTKVQLGTLSGVPTQKSTFRGYMSWLKSNGLVEVEGDMVKLRAL